MIVYRGTEQIIEVVVDNTTQLKKSLLGKDLVQSSFTISSYFEFKIGDYIEFNGIKYTILDQPKAKKIKDNEFGYDIDFKSDQYKMSSILMLLEGQNEFYLLGDLKKFLNVIVSNLNRVLGENYYTIGTVPETDVKNLNFSNISCLDALSKICSEFEVEYTFSSNGRVISLVDKIGNETELVFEFKKGLRTIERKNLSDTELVTRLYVFGGNRNITNDYGGSSYSGTRLRLPESPYYLEKNTDKFGVVEGVVNFDDIYPHRTGTVSSVNSDDILEFNDSSMDFDLNDYLIDGVTAKVTFNTGRLAGYEFEISQYTHSAKRFNIIQYEETTGGIYPSEVFKIAKGDEYVLHDIQMPQNYIDDAEAKLNAKGQEYLGENSLPNVLYDITPDPVYLRKNLIHLKIGDLITVKDTDFGIDFETRILELTQSLADEYNYTIKVGNKIAINYVNRVLNNQLELNESIKIEKYNRELQYNRIRRNFKDIEELKDLIFDPDGYFDTDKIKPLSIETNMLSVGSKGQQFIIRNLLIQANYQSDKNKINCGTGVLVHFTIEDTVKEWNLTGITKTVSGDTKAFYIYAKCSKSTNTGTFIIDENKINTDQQDYYYFLIGVLHSVQDNVRGISLTYGQTTINGRFITTGKVQSVDGINFFDLDTGQFNLGDGESGLDWSVTEQGKLTIRGSLFQTPSGDILPYGTNNLIEWRDKWTIGSGSTTLYGIIGQVSENLREYGVNPFGVNSLLWKCQSDNQPGPDGGWNTESIKIDKNYAYRYCVFVKRNHNDGVTYHGCSPVKYLNNNDAYNAYFWNGDLPNINTWYLMVGVIHAHNHGTNDIGVSGVYDLEGNKVLDGTEFKWNSDAEQAYFRSYLYYSVNTSVIQHFYNPMVHKLDGTEPTISQILNRGEKGQDGEDGATGPQGAQGPRGYVGDRGPGIVYEGVFNSSTEYQNTSSIRSAVKYGSYYYLYKGEHMDSGSWSAANWEAFGSQFSSVATDLLLANNAHIADWIIRNGKITSQNTYNGTPRAELDGTNGGITLVSPMTTYTETGGSRTYTQTLTMSSSVGRIQSTHTGDTYQQSGTAYLDSEGIYANFAGIEYNHTLGGYNYRIKTAMAGYGYGKLTDSYGGRENAVVGVLGKATNYASSNKAAAFGGMFFDLKTKGLHFQVTAVSPNSSQTSVSQTIGQFEDVVFASPNSKTVTVYLPLTNLYNGRVVMVKKLSSGNLYIRKNSYPIYRNGYVDVITVTDGDMWMFIYYAGVWSANVLTR